ncbi:unnamed protein product, partial [Brachionus calyciflorus]
MIKTSQPDNSEFKVLIDLGDDDDLRTFSLEENKSLVINKTYYETGTYRIKAILLDTPLNNTDYINVRRKMLEVDNKNNYQGCFYDRKPFEMDDVVYVNKFNMTNALCEEICANYGYNFSSTYNGYKCSCGDSFGLYNSPKVNESCSNLCSGNESEICGGRRLRSYGIFNSDPMTLYYGDFEECTTINLSILNKTKTSNHIYECINWCQSNNFTKSIFNSSSCSCSMSNYEINGLDYTNALCDYTNRASGSEYYIKSVYKVQNPLIVNNTGKYYLEHLGCFSFNSQGKYVEFKEMSISKCMIYCKYTNSNVLASMGKICYCFNSTQNNQTSIKDIFCQDISQNERHFIGNKNQDLTDHYIINDLNDSLEINNNFYAVNIGCFDQFLHKVISLSLKNIFECQSFCYNLNYSFTRYRLNYCYCGKIIDYKVDSECYDVYKLLPTNLTILTTTIDAETISTSWKELSSFRTTEAFSTKLNS